MSDETLTSTSGNDEGPITGRRALFPPAQWLTACRPQWLVGDAVAGVTLATYAIPVSLAYASLAGLPPQHGIYGYLLGGLFYALFGTSRQLAVGPTSAISIQLPDVAVADVSESSSCTVRYGRSKCAEEKSMQHAVLLAPTLLTIVLMSDVRVSMAAMATPTEQMPRQDWSRLEEPSPLSALLDRVVPEHWGGTRSLWLIEEENAAPGEVERDWHGLRRDTMFFLGYQMLAAGLLYLLPESVTQWTPEQKKTSMSRWWENVQHPQWDKDTWYVNYLGHPYFGAISYIRARERGFSVFGGFGFAALLSTLYEYGIEALFERPSYQDLIVTPVAGVLLGALLFEPLRERLHGKPELEWYDHVTLFVTDPMGVANSALEGALGIQADIRVQFHLQALASYDPFTEPTARSLSRPQEQPRWFPGIGITLVFGEGTPPARRMRWP